jgi:Mitochondrial carrier protein
MQSGNCCQELYLEPWRKPAPTHCELRSKHLYSLHMLILFSDVLRRRFQVNTMPGMGYKYTSIWGAVRQIVQQEGVRGFYKGLTPNLLKVAPSMAANWLSFEVARDFFVSLHPEL